MSSLEKPKVGAYVLIHTEPGAEPDVVNELRKKGCVKEAHHFYGVYDCVAKIETEKGRTSEIVEKEIKSINGVRTSLTTLITSDENGPLGFIKDEKGNFVYKHPKV